SLINKCILVPAALAISLVAPWLITPLLMLGGLYLCFEGFEKVTHTYFHTEQEDEAHDADLLAHVADPEVDLVAYERDKIRGAVRTDFILSAEIIVLTLGIVADMNLLTRVLVLSGIALIMTFGVYGLVAVIVKIDDAGVYLMARKGESIWVRALRSLGSGLLAFAPWLMKALSVVGTIAMFLVGGGILMHGVHALDEFVRHFATGLSDLAWIGPTLTAITPTLFSLVLGMFAGAVVLALVTGWQRLRGN
ncbi:MAG: putative DNA repair protein MutK, partial [Bacteroidia bacterium]